MVFCFLFWWYIPWKWRLHVCLSKPKGVYISQKIFTSSACRWLTLLYCWFFAVSKIKRNYKCVQTPVDYFFNKARILCEKRVTQYQWANNLNTRRLHNDDHRKSYCDHTQVMRHGKWEVLVKRQDLLWETATGTTTTLPVSHANFPQKKIVFGVILQLNWGGIYRDTREEGN